MKKSDVDYTLYLCTDRDLMRADTVEDAVRQALLCGVTMVQLREKNCSAKEFFETAQRVKKITDQAGVPLTSRTVWTLRLRWMPTVSM